MLRIRYRTTKLPQDARGRRHARPPRSRRRAMRCEARDQAPAPTAIGLPSDAVEPGLRAHSLAGTLRMTQLHPPVQRGDTAIAGRLVEYRIALDGGCEGFRVLFLLHLEGIEAGAQH